MSRREFQLPTWTAAQSLLAPRTLLGPFIWWGILGRGLEGITLVPQRQQGGQAGDKSGKPGKQRKRTK